MVKNLPANSGDARKVGLIPGSREDPLEQKMQPLQCSFLENSMDSGPWRATVQEVAGSDTTEETEHSWSPGAMCLWSSSS